MAIETPTWIYKSKGDKQTASEMNQLAQSVIMNATELLNIKDDFAELSNKTYNPETYSGMGRVILRKNMVNGVNVLTQEMINQSNTIYEIRYDFTLDEDITIPANCILEFDGGSISGAYTISGNTYIKAEDISIFDGVSVELRNDVIYANWWKFGNDLEKNSINLQHVFDAAYSAHGCVVKVTEPITFSQTVTIWSYSTNSYNGYTLSIEGQQTASPLFIFNNSTEGSKAFVIKRKTDGSTMNGHCVKFNNIFILSENASYLIYTNNASKIEFNNCSLECITGVCFYSSKIWDWKIIDSNVSGKTGIEVDNGTSVYISNLFVRGTDYGIKLGGSYIHISNMFGDYARGTFARFSYCRGTISSIATESVNLDKFIDLEQSFLEIQSIYYHNLVNSDASVFSGSNSSVHVGSIFALGSGDTGYLEAGGWGLRIEIDKLCSQLNYKETIHNDDSCSLLVHKYIKGNNVGLVQSTYHDRTWYRPIDDVTLQTETYDGYYKQPRYPKKARIVLGSVAPRFFIENKYDEQGNIVSEVSDKQYDSVNVGDIFLNSDVNYSPNDGVFFGWVCSGHASASDKTFGNASYKKVQFVLSGTTLKRPTSIGAYHKGLQFFDETLNKPIWWNGANWVDSTGATV